MKIVQYPHPALRRVARPLTAIDKQVRMQAEAMLELMYDHKGLGLAANQVALALSDHRPELHRRPAAARQGGRLHQPRHPRTQGHDRGRRRLPELPRPVRQGPPGQDVKVQAYNLKGESSRSPPATWPPAPGSTRSTTSTASCSSTRWAHRQAGQCAARSRSSSATSAAPRSAARSRRTPRSRRC